MRKTRSCPRSNSPKPPSKGIRSLFKIAIILYGVLTLLTVAFNLYSDPFLKLMQSFPGLLILQAKFSELLTATLGTQQSLITKFFSAF